MTNTVTAAGVALGGRYRLDRRLGAGGGAEVWEGYDTVLARSVAITLPLDGSPAEAGFADRAKAAARITHPGIVATYDAGVDNGRSYAITELVRGWTLEALLQRGPLRTSRAVAVGTQIAAALDHVHRQGMAHGHVSAATVVLDPDGVAKLADLGGIGWSPTELGPARPADDVTALGRLLVRLSDGQPGSQALRMVAERTAGGTMGSAAIVERALADLVDSGEEDDAAPMVERDPTPAMGIKPVSRRPPSGKRTGEIIAVSVAVLVAALIALLLGGRSSGTNSNGGGGGSSPTVPIASAASFDPQGDGAEGKPELAIDGQAATAWQTDKYRGPNFGGLKKQGVGLVLKLAKPASLKSITLASTTKDWAVQVYVADSVASNLAGWGAPAAEKTGITGDATLDLGNKTGGAVLVWVTNPGSTFQGSITEATLSG